jgi:hypothetical protein
MRQINYFSLKTRGWQIEGERQPLDEYLAHVPDVEARWIVRTARVIEKGRGSSGLRPGRPPICSYKTHRRMHP